MRLSALIFQRWPSLKMFLFYSYLKSTLSTLRELIFTRNNFHDKIFKLFFFIFARINFCEETYFTYFARTKFSEFCKKDILPVAFTFCMRLKKAFTRLARDLICTIQKLKIFTELHFSNFANWQFTNNFSKNQGKKTI